MMISVLIYQLVLPTKERGENVNNLLRLIGRRLVALPIMALGVTVLVFFLMSFSKTDPAYTALGDGASPEAVAEYHEKYVWTTPGPCATCAIWAI